MVNTTKVFAKLMTEVSEIARETGLTESQIEDVLNTATKHVTKRRRIPIGPPPDGTISIGAAGRKYGIAHSTISRWVNVMGYIPIVCRKSNRVYIDESVLAEIATEYHKNPGQGKKTVKKALSN